MGRKTKIIYPDGFENYYVYDLAGRMTAVSDSAGNLSQFSYDYAGRLSTSVRQSAGLQKEPGGAARVSRIPETIYYAYDLNDRISSTTQLLASEVNVLGAYVTSFQYDNLGRLTSKAISHQYLATNRTVEAIDTTKYTYYNVLAPTLVSGISNRYMSLKFSYETQPPYNLVAYSEEPTSEGLTLGLEAHRFEVTPDISGPRGLISRDGARLISSVYDPSGHLRSITGNFGNNSVTDSFTYDALFRRIGIASTTGTSGVFTYDDADRLKTLIWNSAQGVLASESLTYALDGRVTQLQREFGSFNYGYDVKNQVGSVSYQGSQSLPAALVNTAITYDPAGNILSYGGRTFQSTAAFTTSIGLTKYIPDSDGRGVTRQIQGPTQQEEFAFFPNGQMRSAVSTTSASNTQYYYDGLGRRIAKVLKVTGQTPSTVIYSHLGASDQILTAKASSGSNVKETLYADGEGIDDHLFEVSATSTKQYVVDHLGSVLNSIVSSAGLYGVFGETVSNPPSSLSYSEPVSYGFTGREYDAETGLYYFRARNYNPDTGKFLTKDSIGAEIGGDINPYRYVRNNPLSYIDPSGLVAATVTLGGAFGNSRTWNTNTGNVVTASSGFVIGTDAGNFSVGGISSTGYGQNIAGGTAGAGLNFGFILGDISSASSVGSATTTVLGPFSYESDYDMNGNWLGFNVSFIGKGLGLSQFTTTTDTSTATVNFGTQGVSTTCH